MYEGVAKVYKDDGIGDSQSITLRTLYILCAQSPLYPQTISMRLAKMHRGVEGRAWSTTLDHRNVS